MKAAIFSIVAFLAMASSCLCYSDEPDTLPTDKPVSQPLSDGKSHESYSNSSLTKPESTWSNGFLSNGWRDSLAIVGVVGVILTAIGVWLSRRSLKIAAQQLDQTRTANEAATTAAIQSLEQSREQYNRHLLNQAHAQIEAAKIFVGENQWNSAAMRLSDLANALTYLGIGDHNWAGYAEKVRKMEDTLGRLATEEIDFTDNLKTKWRKLYSELSSCIIESSTPFPPLDKEHTHD